MKLSAVIFASLCSFAVAKDNPDLNAFCFCATNFVGYNDGVFDGASNETALVCDSLGDGWKQYLWEGDGFVHCANDDAAKYSQQFADDCSSLGVEGGSCCPKGKDGCPLPVEGAHNTQPHPPETSDENEFCLCVAENPDPGADYEFQSDPDATTTVCQNRQWDLYPFGEYQTLHCKNDQAFDQAQAFADDCAAQNVYGAKCCPSGKTTYCPDPIQGKSKTGAKHQNQARDAALDTHSPNQRIDKNEYCYCGYYDTPGDTTGPFIPYDFITSFVCLDRGWAGYPFGADRVTHCANSQAFDQAQSFADDCFARYADGALCCQSKKKGCGKPVLGRNLTGTTP